MAQRENIPPRFQRMAQQQQGGPGGKGLGQTMSGQPPMAMGGPGGPGGGMMSSLPPVTGTHAAKADVVSLVLWLITPTK